MKTGSSARICVIGAGPSGITAAKNLLQNGLTNFVIYEKNDQVGGNWVFSPRLSHSSVYETTHIISSKTMSQFEDYPMPDDYPDYPSHKQVLAYFQAYAQHFGVMEHIRFNTEVRHAEKLPDETWRITLGDGTVEQFDYLIVANGHHSNPKYPKYPGEYTGQLLHSHEFKTNAPFRDQRVLVIGGGNSACDIAVETSRVSTFTAISMRRGYYITPKFMFGKPTDVTAAQFNWLPRPLYRTVVALALRLNVGDYASYGLQRPDHGILKSHVTANSELLYYIKHGKVHVRRDIERFDGLNVHFVDGTVEPYDVVIAATGFHISFPFFDPAFIDFSGGKPVSLYLHVFHPDHPTLFFIGLVQPLGAIWPLADLHAQLAAHTIAGTYTPPADLRERVAQEVAYRERNFIKAERHTIEVEVHVHRRQLLRELSRVRHAAGVTNA